ARERDRRISRGDGGIAAFHDLARTDARARGDARRRADTEFSASAHPARGVPGAGRVRSGTTRSVSRNAAGERRIVELALPRGAAEYGAARGDSGSSPAD